MIYPIALMLGRVLLVVLMVGAFFVLLDVLKAYVLWLKRTGWWL